VNGENPNARIVRRYLPADGTEILKIPLSEVIDFRGELPFLLISISINEIAASLTGSSFKLSTTKPFKEI
jgi:hypothetical protein